MKNKINHVRITLERMQRGESRSFKVFYDPISDSHPLFGSGFFSPALDTYYVSYIWAHEGDERFGDQWFNISTQEPVAPPAVKVWGLRAWDRALSKEEVEELMHKEGVPLR